MVKCRNHPYEQEVGVCASCLRERLLAVVASQTGRTQRCCAGTPVHQGPPPAGAAHLHQKQQQEEKQKQKETPAPPLLFPRCLSPCVAHQRSVDDPDFPAETDGRCRRRQPVRFYSTPQVVPAGGGARGGGAGFSIISSLFGGGGRQFRSEDSEQDSKQFASNSGGARRGSWFTALVSGGTKKNKKKKDAKHFAAEMAKENSARGRRKRREPCRNRGMSPAEDGPDDARSGSSTESPNQWQRPEPTPLQKPATQAHSSAMSGFVFCLSPMVRATPRQSHVAEGNTAAGIAGELPGSLGRRCHYRGQHHHRVASGGGGPPSLGPNRSRKLVDIGRFH